MNSPIPAVDYVEHFDPDLPHHRAWLLAVLQRLVAHEPQALEEGGLLRRLWTANRAGGLETAGDASSAAAAPAAVIDIPAAVAVARPLVREFEGCKLSAHPDPETGGDPWTIGWAAPPTTTALP